MKNESDNITELAMYNHSSRRSYGWLNILRSGAAMGQRAGQLFEERFRADIIYPKLAAHLEKLAPHA